MFPDAKGTEISEHAQQQLKERGVFDEFIGDKPVIEMTPEEFFDAAKLRERLRRAAGN